MPALHSQPETHITNSTPSSKLSVDRGTTVGINEQPEKENTGLTQISILQSSFVLQNF